MIAQEDKERLERVFAHHPPTLDQGERYTMLRSKAKEFAEVILTNCPNSRERALAITKIEEAVFWMNASIARNE